MKKIGSWGKFLTSLGFEPDGIAKIATDAHGPYQIYIATSEAGIQILYDYLGLKYVAPTPPTKAINAKPQAPTQAKPVIPVSTPKTVPPAVAASAPVQQTPQPPRPAPTPSAQPAPAPQKTVPKGQYRPHAWGQKVGGSEQASAESKSSDDKSA